jgi:phosphoglycolate phosphatase
MPQKILEHVAAFETLVWDWNGTLLDDISVILKAEAEHFPQYGVPAPTLAEREKHFCFPIQLYYERLGFDFRERSFADVNRHFMDIYERHLLAAPLFSGAAELLRQLKAAGKRQFILSAAPQVHLNEVVERHGIRECFAGVYGLPNTDAHSKVARGQDLLREHALDPTRTLLIGDTEHDAEVARALGFEALLVADGHRPYSALVAMHSRVIHTRY